MNKDYLQTVQLLLRAAPEIFRSDFFALKGGTAINLFVQNMPRLSVDIDVVFLPRDMLRDEALATIGSELNLAKERLETLGLSCRLKQNKDATECKLFVTDGITEVKVEVNFVFRGTACPIVVTALTPFAQEIFSANINLPILTTAELYGSKLVAALDRQHPRDLFDVFLMYKNFGLTKDIIDCFVVYLAGHNRPMHEVLFPNELFIDEIFDSEFVGMTNVAITLDDLKSTRSRLLNELPKALTVDHRSFLLSLVKAEPDWSLAPFENLQQLPAIRWKLENLASLRKKNPVKFQQQHAELLARISAC